MGKEKTRIQKSISRHKGILVCSSILSILLLALEIYMLLQDQDVQIIVGVAVVFAISVFLVLNSLSGIHQANRRLDRENMEELYKAQKASYLVIRKNFDELLDRMDSLEDNASLPADDMIKAQKALAKITIERNKENADALMNSNEVLTNKLFSLEEKQNEASMKMISEQEKQLEDTKHELLNRNDELRREFDRLDDLNRQFDRIDDLKHEFARFDDLNRQFDRIDDLRREFDRIDDLRREFDRIDDLRREFDRIHDSMRIMQQSISSIEQTQRAISMQQPMMMAMPTMQQPMRSMQAPIPPQSVAHSSGAAMQNNMPAFQSEEGSTNFPMSEEAPPSASGFNFSAMPEVPNMGFVSDGNHADPQEEARLDDMLGAVKAESAAFMEPVYSREEPEVKEASSLEEVMPDMEAALENAMAKMEPVSHGPEEIEPEFGTMPEEAMAEAELPEPELPEFEAMPEEAMAESELPESELEGMPEEAMSEPEPIGEIPSEEMMPEEQIQEVDAEPILPMEEQPQVVADEEMIPGSEETVVDEIVDPNAKLDPDQIAAMFASVDAAPEPEPEPIPEPEPLAPEPEPAPEPMVEMPTDPNAKMDPDQIAAMFASMEAAPEPEPEPIPEPEPPAPEPEPVAEMPTDPNAKLDPDQIAAMFASMEAAPAPEPEPVPEPVPVAPEPQGDPNKMMSAEEIEALFANL